MTRKSLWQQQIEQDPAHSQWYIQRWRTMAARGDDIVGEARMIDAMLPRGGRVLDAGCGQGRIGGHLHTLGHQVVGVDLDPTLIEAAEADHPGPTWLVGDLVDLDLPARGVDQPFDAIVCAGNVMTFAHPDTRADVVARLGAHLALTGRLAVGFGAGRGYEFTDFLRHADEAGLATELLLESWDLRPWTESSEFLVAVLSNPNVPSGSGIA